MESSNFAIEYTKHAVVCGGQLPVKIFGSKKSILFIFGHPSNCPFILYPIYTKFVARCFLFKIKFVTTGMASRKVGPRCKSAVVAKD